MAVNLPAQVDLKPVPGVRIASAAAGIRYPGRDDVVLIEAVAGTQVAAVTTRNAFCAAPVQVVREHLAQSRAGRALLINAGNANAGTGRQGLDVARGSCAALAGILSCDAEQVLPFSTGVIGEQLPASRLHAALPHLVEGLEAEGWNRAARAIMTTDTVPKGQSRQFELGGRTVTLTGIVKGSGMIRPDMATMLAFIACDATVPAQVLQPLLAEVADLSFNCITVDGDTSTNDACVLLATGQSGAPPVATGGDGYAVLREQLIGLCQYLAQACIRDAEGATRFLTVQVDDGVSRDECRQVAYTVAHSPLVKTAAFAADPNWGRILAAVGRSGVADLDLSGVDLYLDDVCLIRGGEPDPAYREEAGASVTSRAEYTIRVVLGRGDAMATVWTSDFSYDYVKINAEYRT